MERTKAESRKVGSECSKVISLDIKDTQSGTKSNHVSPSTVKKIRKDEEVSRNKRHNVSQEKQSSFSKNTFQSKVVINTIKNNKLNNYNMTKNYIKRINPNFVVSSSKPK